MKRTRIRDGFSLIELLAVIAIIALLAALLFPVFARSRDTANQSRCLNNLRQLAAAFALYSQDYDGHFPHQAILPPDGTNLTCWDVQLKNLIKDRQVLACPSDTESRHLDIPEIGKKLVRSYGMTANTSGRAQSEIALPAQTVLLLERSSVGTQNAPRASLWAYEAIVKRLGKLTLQPIGGLEYVPPDFRHYNRGNYLFVDGHARSYDGPKPTFPGYQTDSDGVPLCGFNDPLPQ